MQDHLTEKPKKCLQSLYAATRDSKLSQEQEREIDRKTDEIVVDKCFPGWWYAKVLGQGMAGNPVYQICKKDSRNECQYALKVGFAIEGEIAKEMGELAVGPRVYDIIGGGSTDGCLKSTSVAIVMEKMDGSLLDFFPFDEEHASMLLPLMVDVIYRCVFDGRINQRDTKLGNFLYRSDEKITVRLADYDIADRIGPGKEAAVFSSLVSFMIKSLQQCRRVR
jgi:hypothetical protein